jgi:hypothetical protein
LLLFLRLRGGRVRAQPFTLWSNPNASSHNFYFINHLPVHKVDSPAHLFIYFRHRMRRDHFSASAPAANPRVIEAVSDDLSFSVYLEIAIHQTLGSVYICMVRPAARTDRVSRVAGGRKTKLNGKSVGKVSIRATKAEHRRERIWYS